MRGVGLAASEFVPGQCWISDTEADLGVGLVKAVDARRVTVLFPAVGEERTYAADNAPLSRVRYGEGDWLTTVDGRRLQVTEVIEAEGRLQYRALTEEGQPDQIVEAELDSFIRFNRPKDRLFAGQIDKNSDFQLRVETLRQRHRHQAAESFGLLGPRVQLLPHQLYIAREVSKRHAPRVLLADEVGLGKTIEAGLIMHQQLCAGRVQRVLVLTPDSLALQWLVEMLRRFNLRFTVIDSERCEALEESGEENPFESAQLVITPLSVLSSSARRAGQAAVAGWDLLVVDEAHHLRWNEQAPSTEYQCVADLAGRSPGLLLLTATPEQLGVDAHYARLRLLDPDRYPSLARFQAEQQAMEPVRELVEAVMALDFPALDAGSEELIGSLEALLGERTAGVLVGAKDAAAFDAGRDEVVSALLDRNGTGRVLFRNTRDAVGGFAERKLVPHALALDDDAAGAINAAGVAAQLQPESVFGDGWLTVDPRVRWVAEWLRRNRDEKLLVICARAATAADLESHLRLREGARTACFHEGMSLLARDRAAAYFADKEEGAQALVCSEIGSEGRNFQFASHLALFDLPMNPDLLEQRIGRLDRIGQNTTVTIHAPHFPGTAQEGLLRWYHEGVDAFERSCPVGATLLEEFGARLQACLGEPCGAGLDALIGLTRDRTNALLRALRDGRDRLLELNSCHPVYAARAVEAAADEARPSELSAYLDRVFDHFGLECERHSLHSVVVKPGNHMTVASFPGLPDDGLTATYRRAEALEREDMAYFTWEHPMVTGAQDLILNGDFGNTALCAAKLPGVREGSLVVECYFVLSCAAPKSFQLGRYLSDSLVRLVLTNGSRSVTDGLGAAEFERLLERVPTRVAQQVVRHARDDISALVRRAEAEAEALGDTLAAQAMAAADDLHRVEIERLEALAAINPNIRAEELEQARDHREDVLRYLGGASLELEALRVVVAT